MLLFPLHPSCRSHKTLFLPMQKKFGWLHYTDWKSSFVPIGQLLLAIHAKQEQNSTKEFLCWGPAASLFFHYPSLSHGRGKEYCYLSFPYMPAHTRSGTKIHKPTKQNPKCIHSEEDLVHRLRIPKTSSFNQVFLCEFVQCFTHNKLFGYCLLHLE